MTPVELPEIWRPPIVEHAIRDGAARYLLAWGDDAQGARWGYLLWPPTTLEARWVRWEEIHPVAGEDYSAVPIADPFTWAAFSD
ncbi:MULTISPECIES: hypothetical protein [unclassified Nonomuraea]|uniref:hypothetical protein n=1 Tax=unclassified Nonomuraea TaxID=2593643 RepID=UPI0035BF1576